MSCHYCHHYDYDYWNVIFIKSLLLLAKFHLNLILFSIKDYKTKRGKRDKRDRPIIKLPHKNCDKKSDHFSTSSMKCNCMLRFFGPTISSVRRHNYVWNCDMFAPLSLYRLSILFKYTWISFLNERPALILESILLKVFLTSTTSLLFSPLFSISLYFDLCIHVS